MLLGINYKKLKNTEAKVETSNHDCINTKTARLNLTIEKTTINIPVLICEEEIECLLGRKGVFDKFDITFRERHQEVIFKKPSPSL